MRAHSCWFWKWFVWEHRHYCAVAMVPYLVTASLSLSVSWKHSSTKWCQPTDPDRNLLQGPLQAWYLTNISVLVWLVVLCLQHNQFLIIIPGCLLGSTSFKQIIWCLFYTYIYNYIYIVRYIWLVGCFKHVSVFQLWLRILNEGLFHHQAAGLDESQQLTKTNRYLMYPLVICYIAIENGPFIVDLPIEHCDFPYLC